MPKSGNRQTGVGLSAGSGTGNRDLDHRDGSSISEMVAGNGRHENLTWLSNPRMMRTPESGEA